VSLTPGDKLGPYEILAPIGASGMREVYRAHDPRHRFPELPNICMLHDVGPNYLVMELVEGENPKGPADRDRA